MFLENTLPPLPAGLRIRIKGTQLKETRRSCLPDSPCALELQRIDLQMPAQSRVRLDGVERDAPFGEKDLQRTA